MQSIKGYTLVELVIVITLIGILAAAPFINWQGKTINLDAEAQHFASDIRYAQSLSMSKAESFRLARTSATTYQILNSAGTAVLLAGGTSVTLNSGLSFSSWGNLSNNLVAFDGQGAPYLTTGSPGTALSFGTTYAITMTDGSTNKTISVTPITGRVTVQ